MTDRPTKKERRELARQAQAQAMRKARVRNVRSRLLRLLFVLGGIGLIVGFFVMQSSRNKARDEKIGTLTTALGCSDLQQFESLGAAHIPQGDITYPRLPPESGDHRPFWAKTGEHTEPIETETQSHNLEHGHVMLQYAASTPPALVTALNDAMRTNPQWVISAPYGEFTDDTTVSLTAWQYRIDCSGLEAGDAEDLQELAVEFINVRRNHGPESIPGEVNDPGDSSHGDPGETMESGG